MYQNMQGRRVMYTKCSTTYTTRPLVLFSQKIDPFLRILKFRPNKNLGHAPPLKIWKWNFIERRGVSKLTKQYFFLSTLIFRGTTFQTIFFLKSCTTASSATFGQLWVGNPYFWPIMGTLLGDHWVKILS